MAQVGFSLPTTFPQKEEDAKRDDSLDLKPSTALINLARFASLAAHQSSSAALSPMASFATAFGDEALFDEVNSLSQQLQALQVKVNNKAQEVFKKRLKLLLEGPEKPHIIMLGKPGGGKGTLCRILNKKLSYVHLSIGDIHRGENEAGTELGLKIRACIKKRDFFGDEMVNITKKLLNPKFEKICKEGKRFVLDNFPTALSYLPYFREIMKEHKLKGRIILVVPEISDLETVSRLSHRVVCSNKECRKIYNLSHQQFTPQKEGECDECRSPLEKRLDERVTTLNEQVKTCQNKIEVFNRFIQPVIEALASMSEMETFILPNDELSHLFIQLQVETPT